MLAISFWFVVKTPETVYQTAKTEQLLIQLPDASEVLLDENSKLVLDADWSEERQLKLEGEAFFKVEKGKPFIVVLPEGEVQVLGTSFRVETTVDELEVACYSGKIKVNYRKSSEVLNPGDQARAEKADKLEVKRGKQIQRADNQETILRFQSRPLAEVFKAMELHFKVKIQFPVSDTRTYTGFFKTADLKEALKTVCVPMSLDYTIKDKTVTITKK